MARARLRELALTLPGVHDLLPSYRCVDDAGGRPLTPADVADLVGGYEGRARAEEWVDDDVAAIGEVEERVREHRGRLGGRVALKAAAGGPRPGLLARGFVAPTR